MSLGSAPEIIAPGKSGFLCHSVEECVNSIPQAVQLSRHDCREYVLMNFTAQRMTDGYEAVYQKVRSEIYSQNGPARSLVMSH
jgi:hypothetical protein